MTGQLVLALATAIEEALESSSDAMIRIELSPRWPVPAAIKALLDDGMAPKVGAMHPFKLAPFKALGLDVEDDPAVLTTERNSRREHDSNYPLLLVGSTSRAYLSGLKRISVVINRKDVSRVWHRAVAAAIEGTFEGKPSTIRSELVDFVFSRLADGRLQPDSAEAYIEVVLDEDADHANLQASLHLLGLIPDDGLLGSSSITARLGHNSELIEQISGGLDADNRLKRLSRSTQPEVASLVRWLNTHKDEDLKAAELTHVLAAIRDNSSGGSKSKKKTDDPPPKRESYSLLEALGLSDIEAADRREILDAVTTALGDEGHRGSTVGIEIAVDKYDVALHVDSSKLREPEWLGEEEIDPNEAVEPPDPQIGFILEAINPKDDARHRRPFKEPVLRKNLAPLSDELDAFFEARKYILKSARLLSADASQVMELLVACPTLRQECAEYVTAWELLLQRGLTSDINEKYSSLLALLDGTWTRELGSGEVLDSFGLNWDASYLAVAMAPWHPWRLQPLVKLADEVAEDFEVYASVVHSAAWALDRAIPAYRIVEMPPATLQYSTTDRGSLLFTSDEPEALPPASGSGGLLARSVAAYAKAHPWAKAGATMALANPPRGGLMRAVVRRAVTAFGHEPALLLLRQRGLAGVVQTDDMPNLVSSLDADRLTEFQEGGYLDRDVTIVFTPGPPGQVSALHSGSHGSIEMRLKSRGMDSEGDEHFVPEIMVGAEADNDLVTLPYRVAGVAEARSASYELVLADDQRLQLEAIADRAAWTIVAIPGAVSAFDLASSTGSPMVRVAEFDEGLYRCFVFAQSMEPLEWMVHDRLRELPVAADVRNQLEDLLSELARAQPQKLFDVAQNRFGEDEALGVIVARAIAQQWAQPGELLLEISLDDASWTQHWLENSGQRADFLLVAVSADPKADRPVRILVVEAKATTAAFEVPSASASPLKEGLEQVEATRDRLLRLTTQTESLVASLRMRAFSEQVAAVAAYAYISADDRTSFDAYFENLTRFAKRPDQVVESIDGLAAALYMSGQEKTMETEIDGVRLVSCSARLLEQLLKKESLDTPTPVSRTEGTGDAGKGPEDNEPGGGLGASTDGDSPDGGPAPGGSTKKSAGGASQDANLASDSAGDPTVGAAVKPVLAAGDDELVERLITALRLRSKDVGSMEDCRVRTGPTFLTVTLPITEGAALAPLQRAEDDIARDSGVPSIEIDNDSERGRLRVLLPRAARTYPTAPAPSMIEGTGVDYLAVALGQDLSGADVQVPISQWPHALVAGSTGSGKTTFLRSVLGQMNAYGPSKVRCAVVDGKGETDYFGAMVNEMYSPRFPEPQLTPGAAVEVLAWLKDEEVPRRKQLVVEQAKSERRRVDAREEYVKDLSTGREPMMTPLVVVIDEFNEIMLRGGDSKQAFVEAVTSVAQAARSVMVHLVLATQRPERAILPGAIKANLPTRIALRLPTAADSLTVLGHGGAERLLGNGDLLLQINGRPDLRLQGYSG